MLARRARRTFVMTEVVILISVVLVATGWACIVLPQAITNHYNENVKVLASPM